ncbi:hypothetical protein G7085_12855 [Tessaracoccus sp. HDW20]|nr:hypothetical protein [Tessaracoccus coleopterorum]
MIQFDGQPWAPTRYTPPLGGGKLIDSDGPRLVELLEKHWTLPDGNLVRYDDPQRAWFNHLLERYPSDWPVPALRGRLRYRQAVTSEGRQNGKSLKAGGLAIYGLTQHVPAPSVVGIATSVEQANVVYRRVKFAVDHSPLLSSVLHASGTRGIRWRDERGAYAVYPSKADGLQSVPVTLGIADELHLMRREMWYSIVNGQRAQADALVAGSPPPATTSPSFSRSSTCAATRPSPTRLTTSDSGSSSGKLQPARRSIPRRHRSREPLRRVRSRRPRDDPGRHRHESAHRPAALRAQPVRRRLQDVGRPRTLGRLPHHHRPRTHRHRRRPLRGLGVRHHHRRRKSRRHHRHPDHRIAPQLWPRPAPPAPRPAPRRVPRRRHRPRLPHPQRRRQTPPRRGPHRVAPHPDRAGTSLRSGLRPHHRCHPRPRPSPAHPSPARHQPPSPPPRRHLDHHRRRRPGRRVPRPGRRRIRRRRPARPRRPDLLSGKCHTRPEHGGHGSTPPRSRLARPHP